MKHVLGLITLLALAAPNAGAEANDPVTSPVSPTAEAQPDDANAPAPPSAAPAPPSAAPEPSADLEPQEQRAPNTDAKPATPPVATPHTNAAPSAPTPPPVATPHTNAAPSAPTPHTNGVAAPKVPPQSAWTAPSARPVIVPVTGANAAPPSRDVAGAKPPRPRDDTPIHSRFVLGLQADSVRHTEPGLELFSTSDVLNSLGAFAGYAVIDGTVAVVPELGFSVGSASRSGTFGGSVANASLDERTLYGGVVLSVEALSFLEPEAHVTVGASTLKVNLEPADGASLQDDDTAAFFTVGGGLTLRTPKGALETQTGAFRSLAFGITLEGGYMGGKAFELTPVAHNSGHIPTENAHLGAIDRAGPYARVAGSIRF